MKQRVDAVDELKIEGKASVQVVKPAVDQRPFDLMTLDEAVQGNRINTRGPSVHILSRPNFSAGSYLKKEVLRALALDAVHLDSFREDAGAALIETAGRICYDSFENPRPGGRGAYIENILREKHGSVFEHANYTLLFEGVSRSLTHELVRHRAGFAYSQESQRYVSAEKCCFIMPPRYVTMYNERPTMSHEACDTVLPWFNSLQHAYSTYVELNRRAEVDGVRETTIERKRRREAARSCLPNATATKIVVTANVRAWRHFLETRGSAGADLEIQRLARHVFHALRAVAAYVFDDFYVDESTGSLACKYSKV